MITRWSTVLKAVEPFLEDCERLYQFHRECDPDYLFVGSAFPHFPWMEAIVGCPVVFSGAAFFAEPYVDDWQGWRAPVKPLETPWGQKLLELLQAVAEHARGTYPVGATLMRGPSDMLAAMRGPSRFPLDLFDCPDATQTSVALVPPSVTKFEAVMVVFAQAPVS